MIPLNVKDLTFTYAGNDFPSLSGINMKVEEGEFVLITGPSGCGKSTLCKSFVGLVPHSYPGKMEGDVEIFGVSVKDKPVSEIATKASLVFQDPENQLFTLSVENDVAFGPENLALPRDEIRERVDWSIGAVRIHDLRYRAPFELSGGQQQRAAIASILAMKPMLLIFDEPTAFLDPVSAKNLFELINSLKQELKITVILVEHRLDMAATLATRIIILDRGRIVLDGEPRKVLSDKVLMKIGVGAPTVTRLCMKLRERGFKMETPISIDEAAKEILKILGGTCLGHD
ncbi:MAG: energy-coupling factor ABC transporter ATP-binding protein [Thermoproteota archaeon]